jgi:probable rRNA maturation factor
VLCVDADYMSTLHERWMGEKGPTDVLAFPMDELDTARPDDPEPGPALLGDVVLCPSVAVRQARAAGHSMDDELVLLATHGVLHLLGYDHMEPDEEKEMFGLQQQLLEGWRSAPREPVTGEAATRPPARQPRPR